MSGREGPVLTQLGQWACTDWDQHLWPRRHKMVLVTGDQLQFGRARRK